EADVADRDLPEARIGSLIPATSEAVSDLLPHRAADIDRLSVRLRGVLRDDEPHVLIHGDLSPDQVLASVDATAVPAEGRVPLRTGPGRDGPRLLDRLLPAGRRRGAGCGVPGRIRPAPALALRRGARRLDRPRPARRRPGPHAALPRGLAARGRAAPRARRDRAGPARAPAAARHGPGTRGRPRPGGIVAGAGPCPARGQGAERPPRLGG